MSLRRNQVDENPICFDSDLERGHCESLSRSEVNAFDVDELLGEFDDLGGEVGAQPAVMVELVLCVVEFIGVLDVGELKSDGVFSNAYGSVCGEWESSAVALSEVPDVEVDVDGFVGKGECFEAESKFSLGVEFSVSVVGSWEDVCGEQKSGACGG